MLLRGLKMSSNTRQGMQLNVNYLRAAQRLIDKKGWDYIHTLLDPVVIAKITGNYWDDDELCLLACYLRYQFSGVDNAL